MTKKVAKRGWSLEKFSNAVEAACKKAGTKYASKKAEQAYKDGWTVAYAVSQMGTSKPTPAKAATKKAA